MEPLSPLSKRILRFQGVQPQVLKALETQRIKKDSEVLFGETMDVFIKRAGQSKGATIDLVSHNENSKSLPYTSGLLRSLHRMLTGQDIQPVEIVKKKHQALATNGDIFQCSIRSDN